MMVNEIFSGNKKIRDAVVISPIAKVIGLVIAAVLSIPVLMICGQDDKVLQNFHNRKLAPWPKISGTFNPLGYFSEAKLWIKDRVYPIIEISSITKLFLLDTFEAAPQRRVSMGKNGFIFLNGSSEQDVFSILENVCIKAHSQETANKLQGAVDSLEKFSRTHHVKIDIVVIPTLPSIYADNLPLSVPGRIRSACMERSKNHSPLVALSETSDGRFTYPLYAMNAARGDDGFFPKANYHAVGMSLSVARDTYLRARNLQLPVNERLVIGAGPSEILASYGIIRNYPVYEIKNDSLKPDLKTATEVGSLAQSFFNAPQVEAQAFNTSGRVNQESVLMLSDSFGGHAAGVFATAFNQLYHVTTNNMPDERALLLFNRLNKAWHFERVILLVQEGNTDRILNWSRALQK